MNAVTQSAASDTQLAFLLDLARCIGCQGCVAACKTGNELPEKTQYIEIGEITQGTFPEVSSFISNHRCYHCADAACVKVCPVSALTKEQGMTVFDRETCIGCGYCVSECPYSVPKLRQKKSAKCDSCQALRAEGGTPWCVQTCPSNAILFGTREEMLAEGKARVAAILERYPNAQLYGETQAGGLGMLVVLPDDPAIWELPLDPDTDVEKAEVYSGAGRAPVLSAGAGIFGALTLGLAAMIGRRNQLAGERAEVAQHTERELHPAD